MLKEILKKYEIVATSQRLDIFSILHNNENYLSAYDLEKELPHLDISTIYRTLNLFDDKKMVVKKFNDNINAFTYKYVSHNHFHHLKCLKCNKVINIEFCPMNVFDTTEADRNHFMITDYTFEVFGYCENCRG